MLARWIVCMGIGIATGAVAFLIDIFGAKLFSLKMAAAGSGYQDTHTNPQNFTDPQNFSNPQNFTASTGAHEEPIGEWVFAKALAIFVGCSLVLASVAAVLCIYVEPVSSGSGIAEVKTQKHSHTHTYAHTHTGSFENVPRQRESAMSTANIYTYIDIY